MAHFWSVSFACVPLVEMYFYKFITDFSDYKDPPKSFASIAVYWVGALIFILSLISHIFDPGFRLEGEKWLSGVGESPFSQFVDFILVPWGLVIYPLTFKVIIKYIKTTFDPLKKKQAKIILWTMILTVGMDVLDAITWYTGFAFYDLPFSSLTILVGVLAFAIVKYDFFSINAASAAESIISTMMDGVVLMSNNKKIFLVNNALLKMIGENDNRMLGKNVSDLIKIDSTFDFTDHVTDREAQIITKSGKTFPVSLSTSLITSSKGEQRGIVCIVRDIRERKEQEEKLEESYRQIQIDFAKLEAVLSSIGEGLVLIDENDKISMINKGCEEMIGWKGQDMLNKDFFKEFVLYDEKGQPLEIKDKIHRTMKSKGIFHFSMSDYVSVGTKEGGKVPVTLTTSPVKLGDDHVGAITIFENMTKDMEIDKAKSEFVSLAAHQLRVPITAIKWNLEILEPEVGKKLTKELFELLKTSYREANNMSDLIDQFLNVSRIELGKISVTPEPIKLPELVGDVLDEQKVTYSSKKQKIVRDIDDKIPAIDLDRVLIRIVIQNLISNAIKYTPEKGVVTVQLLRKDECAEFIVKDTGMGIPKEQQKNIFAKMFRAQNALSSGIEGNGLGLYITKSIVQIARGEIIFESEVNKGTTFKVTIPYKGMEKKVGTKPLIESKAK